MTPQELRAVSSLLDEQSVVITTFRDPASPTGDTLALRTARSDLQTLWLVLSAADVLVDDILRTGCAHVRQQALWLLMQSDLALTRRLALAPAPPPCSEDVS